MKIFHYHSGTGVYLGSGLADESPLEPGVWLVPAHATSTAPPKAQAGKQQVWINGTWTWQPIPEPAPEPIAPPTPEPLPALTPAEKLASIGLSVEELRQLLSD
jgi:hypothetical protein